MPKLPPSPQVQNSDDNLRNFANLPVQTREIVVEDEIQSNIKIETIKRQAKLAFLYLLNHIFSFKEEADIKIFFQDDQPTAKSRKIIEVLRYRDRLEKQGVIQEVVKQPVWLQKLEKKQKKHIKQTQNALFEISQRIRSKLISKIKRRQNFKEMETNKVRSINLLKKKIERAPRRQKPVSLKNEQDSPLITYYPPSLKHGETQIKIEEIQDFEEPEEKQKQPKTNSDPDFQENSFSNLKFSPV